MWRLAAITLNTPQFLFVFGSGYAGLGSIRGKKLLELLRYEPSPFITSN